MNTYGILRGAVLLGLAFMLTPQESVEAQQQYGNVPRTYMRDNPVYLTAALPQVGDRAPDFLLVDVDLSEKKLADYGADKKIISIVPSLDTSTCALSAKVFNEKVSELGDTVIINVSMDLPFANKRFCELENLEIIHALSAYRSPHFGRTYGVRMQNGPLEGLFARAVLVLDGNNIVRHVELVENISDEPNYDAAFAALAPL